MKKNKFLILAAAVMAAVLTSCGGGKKMGLEM
jgi:predicted small secreted protein